MTDKCKFCNKELEQVDHTNREIFDIFMCNGCLKPNYDTVYRRVHYKGQPKILATTIRIDEFYVILNHELNYVSKRAQYTQIYKYKKVLGIMNTDPDPQPITWAAERPVCDLDIVLDLPLNNPMALKEKLKIYTLFS